MKPLVSVVIDNFNYAQFLPAAIESALLQRYPRVEVVVVDDGSADGSRDIIRGFGSDVTAVFKPNGGQGSAINAGVEVARGEVVLFLDADDLLHQDAVDRVIGVLAPHTAKVHFRLGAVDGGGLPLGYTVPPDDRRLGHGDVTASLLSTGRYVTPTMSGNAFPRWVLDRILPVPEEQYRISADGYLVTAAAFHGPVAALEEVLGSYRVHGANWWAPDELEVARLRAFVDHDLAKHRCVYDNASAAGMAVRRCLPLGDHFHLRSRLGSLRLDPGSHPISVDGRAHLWRAGVGATLRSDLRPGRRVAFVAWFSVVAFGPRRVAEVLLTWLHVPRRRPRLRRRVVHRSG